VIFIGDKISKGSQIAVGGEAIIKINSIKPDLCLLGVNAIDISNGITDNDWDVMQVKKAMVEAASQTAVLTITEKMNTCQKLKICDIDQVNYLITEIDYQHDLFKDYANTGIQIL
jgi:DeoR/GlpR family transcriptional regulator of sugar metabolism